MQTGTVPSLHPQMHRPIQRADLGRSNLKEGMTIPRDGRTITVEERSPGVYVLQPYRLSSRP